MIHSLLGIIALLFLSTCRTLDPDHDRDLDPVKQLTKQQIEQKLLTPSPSQKKKPRPAVIPPLSSVIPATFTKLVSLSVTETTPLKDVLFQMARQANIDLSLDSDIKGGATFHATQRPFIEVVQELCSTHQLRYKTKNNILRVEADKPYLTNYNIQFLSLIRNNQSRISVATNVFTSSEGQSNNTDNGSTNLLTGETKSDLWTELEKNIATILHHVQATPDATHYSLHRQAGLLSVYATQAQHHQVENFLKMLKISLSSQVLIEAKIVEVILKDEFKTGINWNLLKGDLVMQAPLGELTTPGPYDKNVLPGRDVFTIGGHHKQLTELVKLVNKFGNVRILSSPRLSAMNNVPGYLKVATNFVYFLIDYNRTYGLESEREQEFISSKIQTVPIGLVLLVHPSINVEDGSITLALRPTISRVVDEKLDPAVSIVSKESYQSRVPEVQVREFDTHVMVSSGQTVVIGGLMQEITKNNQSGVPYLSEVPVVGNLAKSTSDDRVISELVIFLKVTIVDNDPKLFLPIKDDSIAPADTQLYENFTSDPRPL